jgi:hypothetical protein
MVRILNIVSVAALALALGAPGVAGSAEGLVTRDLAWSGGDQFGVAMSAKATFTQAPQTKITVTGPRDIVDRMIVDNGVVKMRDRVWNWGRNGAPVTITASAPHVRKVIAAASARIETGTLQEPTLALHASSSGSIRGAVKTGSLDADASSSGSVHATGSADRVDVDTSSSGRVDLHALSVQDAVVNASSSGGAELSPSRSARVNASSSGHVRLLQRPAQLDSRTSSSGHISVG